MQIQSLAYVATSVSSNDTEKHLSDLLSIFFAR